MRRITDIFSSSLEIKRHCEAVFLDVIQTYDRWWTEGLFHKIRFLPASLVLTLKSFLSSCTFSAWRHIIYTPYYGRYEYIPRWHISSYTLQLFTSDIPRSNDTYIATFNDDTAIISSHPNLDQFSKQLQDHLLKLRSWFHLWKIKINEIKFNHITFMLRSINSHPLSTNKAMLNT